jgi:hypothetical protein
MTKPGRWLRRFAALICRPETVERISDPILADLQHEDEAAACDGRPWRRRWMRFRGYAAFWKTMAVLAGQIRRSRSAPAVSHADSTGASGRLCVLRR